MQVDFWGTFREAVLRRGAILPQKLQYKPTINKKQNGALFKTCGSLFNPSFLGRFLFFWGVESSGNGEF